MQYAVKVVLLRAEAFADAAQDTIGESLEEYAVVLSSGNLSEAVRVYDVVATALERKVP